MWQFKREVWVKLVQGTTSSPYFLMKTTSNLQMLTFCIVCCVPFLPSSPFLLCPPLSSSPSSLFPTFFFLNMDLWPWGTPCWAFNFSDLHRGSFSVIEINAAFSLYITCHLGKVIQCLFGKTEMRISRKCLVFS